MGVVLVFGWLPVDHPLAVIETSVPLIPIAIPVMYKGLQEMLVSPLVKSHIN